MQLFCEEGGRDSGSVIRQRSLGIKALQNLPFGKDRIVPSTSSVAVNH
jgi:hypothetical protein